MIARELNCSRRQKLTGIEAEDDTCVTHLALDYAGAALVELSPARVAERKDAISTHRFRASNTNGSRVS